MLREKGLSACWTWWSTPFLSFTVEQVNIWNYANAFVTTIEVWDLRVFTDGGTQLSEELGQRSRVKYQMKRVDSMEFEEGEEEWLILHREIDQSFE